MVQCLLLLCEPKGQEVAGVQRELHNEEHHKLYSSTNITRLMKLKRMIWMGWARWEILVEF
jgi:hypothetical protein